MIDSTLSPTEETSVQPMRWPPPGLGRIQGDLWIVARKMAVVAMVLVLPLLIVLTFPQSPYGLGPLGEAWWIMLLTTVLGVALFTDAVVSLVRFLSRVRRALAEGYTRHVVGLVVADRDRDNGFLLQGIKAFSALSDSERRTLGRLRFLGPLGYLVGATWLVVGFGLLLLLAARGAVSLTGVGFGTVGPAAFLWFFGLVLRATEGTIVYRAREAWHANEWAEDLARQETEAWQIVSEDRGFVEEGSSLRRAAWWPTAALIGVVVGAFVTVIPAMTLVPAASLGAIFSQLGGLSFERSLRRSAESEAYRAYRVEPDSAVGPAEAGEILYAVARAGYGPSPVSELREPATVYEEPWVPDGAPEGFRPEADPYWSDTIWTWVERGLTAEERAYLEEVADHPARDDLARLARAPSIDILGAMYDLPFAEDATVFSLPIPRLSAMRQAANSHFAHAALQAADGRHADAEQAVREVISVGFLLADEGPILVVNFLGAVLIRRGGEALARAVDLAGDPDRAAGLRESAEVARAAAERMSVTGLATATGDGYLERLPGIAEDPRAIRGLRWEAVQLVTVFTPCANLRRVVFGPDDEVLSWREQVRSSLVRYDSEEAYFDVSMRGIAPMAEPGLLSRFLAVAMGGLSTQGSCAQVLAALPDLQ